MVFGFFHTAAGGSTSQNSGADLHEHSRPHKTHLNSVAAAAAELTVAAPEEVAPPSSTAASATRHHVLNNGHRIRHLASHGGYAVSTDGVRLYYEVFGSHKQPAAGGTHHISPMSYEVKATAGPPVTGAVLTTGMPGAAEPASLFPPADLPSTPRSAVDAGPDAVGAGLTPSARAGAPTSGSPTATPAALPVEDGRRTDAHRGPPSPGGDVAASGTGRAAAAAEIPGESGRTGEPQLGKDAAEDHLGDTADLLLIMGFAAGRHGWLPLIHHWMQQAESEPLHRLRARFCVFDNRGIGDSDSPQHAGSYSTAIMARDALAIMDHLGWRKAHVVGFSMGGMVALRLAVAAPERLLSLTVLSVTNGGWQVIPTRWRSLKLLLLAATARNPRQRAHADVHFHFSRDTLHAEMRELQVPKDGPDCGGRGGADAATARTKRIEAALIEEYVTTSKEGAPQPHTGLMGQLHAVWTHGLSLAEQHGLRQLTVPVKVIHGYHDVMAMPVYGERIAKHARAAFIMLNGGHFIARECAPEVCMHIADSVASAKKLT